MAFLYLFSGLLVKLDVSNVLESFESLKTDEYIGEDEGVSQMNLNFYEISFLHFPIVPLIKCTCIDSQKNPTLTLHEYHIINMEYKLVNLKVNFHLTWVQVILFSVLCFSSCNCSRKLNCKI